MVLSLLEILAEKSGLMELKNLLLHSVLVSTVMEKNICKLFHILRTISFSSNEIESDYYPRRSNFKVAL